MKLKDLRNRSKLSVEQVSERVGVTKGTWYRWESHFSEPKIGKALAIMGALGCSLEELAGAIDPPIEYPKRVEIDGEEYIRCTLLLQEEAYDNLSTWVDYIERDGVYTNKEIIPRRNGRAVELALAEAMSGYGIAA